MKKISSYIWDYRFSYLGAILSLVIAVTLDMLAPRLTARVVDDVMDDNGVPLIGRVELGVLRPEKTGPRSFPPVWPKRP